MIPVGAFWVSMKEVDVSSEEDVLDRLWFVLSIFGYLRDTHEARF